MRLPIIVLFLSCFSAEAAFIRQLSDKVAAPIARYISPATRPQTTSGNTIAIQRDVLTLMTSAKLLHDFTQGLQMPEFSDELVEYFSPDDDVLLFNLLKRFKELDTNQKNQQAEAARLEMAVQLAGAAVLGSTGAPTRSGYSDVIGSRGLTIFAASTVIDRALVCVQRHYMPSTSDTPSQLNEITRRATSFLAAGLAYELAHPSRNKRFIELSLLASLVASFLPAARDAVKTVPMALVCWWGGRKISKFFGARERAEKELLAIKIREEYTKFCNKYQKGIDSLDKRIQNLEANQDDTNQALSHLLESSHHDIKHLTSEVTSLHAELEKVAKTHKSDQVSLMETLMERIKAVESSIATVQTHGVDSLNGVSTQLSELKGIVTQANERTDIIDHKLQNEALPKMSELLVCFHTFAQKEKIRFAAVLKAMVSNKTMREILNRELQANGQPIV